MIFFLFLHKKICCGYWFEVPHRGTSNEYPQHMFCGEIRKIILWLLPLSGDMKWVKSSLIFFSANATHFSLIVLIRLHSVKHTRFSEHANSKEPDQPAPPPFPGYLLFRKLDTLLVGLPRWHNLMLVWLAIRRSQVQSSPGQASFFAEIEIFSSVIFSLPLIQEGQDWSWNIFYGHSLPSADSRRAVCQFLAKECAQVLVNRLED